MWFFRAVAFDLDGTLASGGRLGEGVLAAIQAARAQRLMVLVTGRILEDLEAAFPGLASRFDAVVAENGAVLSTRLGSRPLAAPVDPALARALAARGVATWSGRVLLALDGADAGLAREVAAALGVDCRLVRNRGAAMILPAGVTKGSGLLAALEEFGLSAHNVIAVGDAENDLALLQAAEVGVAVANAVPSLAAHADLRLGLPDGAGVAQLLGGPLLSGTGRLCPPRRWVPIGNFADGEPARLPGSQASVLVIGDAGSGASHLAGLLAERWIDAGYAVLVLDPEGDHVGLAQRPGVHLVDAAAAHPTGPSDVLARMRTTRASLVLDLSGLPDSDRTDYLRRLSAGVAAARAGYGLPHWVIVDEAHLSLRWDGTGPGEPGVAEPGVCLVARQPDTVPATVREAVDVIIQVAEDRPSLRVDPLPGPRTTTQIRGGPPRAFTVADRARRTPPSARAP